MTKTDISIDDSTYHYPPELLDILTDAIIRLNRAKDGVVTFFRGAGITSSRLEHWRQRIAQDRAGVRKAEIARDILRDINERQGNDGLRWRREVIKRVAAVEDFSACWESDRLEAEVLVGRIRCIVHTKDSFTRMERERRLERARRMEESQARADAIAARKNERERIKKDLFGLFNESDPNKRGTALEGILNELFASYAILVRESFRRQGRENEGVVEQIDGVISLDGHLYLVEMKWHSSRLGTEHVNHHLVRVFNRGDVRGLVISASGYTQPAIDAVRDTLTQKVVTLVELSELVHLLESDGDLPSLIRKKVEVAQLDKEPFHRIG